MTPDQLRRLETLEQQMREHDHNGVVGRQIDIQRTTGNIKVITVAADLTARLAGKPRDFPDQLLIDTTTGTKKLYIYDADGDVWRSVTIT
jgi:hypothetical protein